MLPGLETLACPEMAVSMDVMQHIVQVESSRNPYAIGVVGGRLARQPTRLDEAVATAKMLEEGGYNFSLGLGQVNRYNLSKYGLNSYEKAFDTCPNLQAASRILAECHSRSGKDWGKAFSCYYSGNFETGFRHGYVDKVFDSMRRGLLVASASGAPPIRVIDNTGPRPASSTRQPLPERVTRANSRIVTSPQDGAALPMDDARAYPVYPSYPVYRSTGDMVRQSVWNNADGALSRVVDGLMDKVMPQTQGQQQPGVAGGGSPMPLPLPGAAGGLPAAAAAVMGSEAPVQVQPWGQQNAPRAQPAPNAPRQPPVDDAFVF